MRYHGMLVSQAEADQLADFNEAAEQDARQHAAMARERRRDQLADKQRAKRRPARLNGHLAVALAQRGK